MATRREQAGLPTYPGLWRAVLETMRSIDLPAARAAICEHVADHLNLTDEQRAVSCANGSMPEYVDRIGWSLSFLKQAGALDNATRGSWDITVEGRLIDFDEVERRITSARAEYHARRRNQEEGSAEIDEDDEEAGGLAESDWQDDLLQRLHTLSPAGFERLSRELLLSAGFDEVEVTQISRDGGIDGVGTYRPSGLISFRTSFQCKRWRDHPVRAPDIQAFQGAIQGQSDRGIILTTSYFTKDATEQANRPGAIPIELIDGPRLIDLLKEYELGVSTELVELVTVDLDYFDKFDRFDQ